MAKRRANGEGNLRKRKDGRWEGRYTAGHDPETGKAIYRNVLGRTQAEARAKLKQAKPGLLMLRITKGLVIFHHLAKDILGCVLRVRHIFHQHQADLIHHGHMAAVEGGHFLSLMRTVHLGHLLLPF